MTYLREYIRSYLGDTQRVSQCYYSRDELDSRVDYDPEVILGESIELAEDHDVIIDGKSLKFFGRNYDGEVAGAAFVCIEEDKFDFVVIVDEEAPSTLHEDLIRECIEEFDFHNQDSLILEVQVDNEYDAMMLQQEGLQVLREYPGLKIMGNDVSGSI